MCNHVSTYMIHVASLQSIFYETVVELQDFEQYKDCKLHDFWKLISGYKSLSFNQFIMDSSNIY